jgi:hypothetical protein
MTPSQLRAAARPLPAPVRGRASFLVGGRFGDGVRTIALNSAGSAVAYGRGGGVASAIASCPEGRFAVEVFSVGRRGMVAVRRVADLRIVRQLALPADRAFCLDGDARTIVVFKAAGEVARQNSTIGVLHGRRLTTLHRGRARSVALHGGSAYFVGGGDGRGLYRLDLGSRKTRRMLTLPANTGQPSISPNGRWLSTVAYSEPTSQSAPPSRLVLADLRSRRVRTMALARANVLGDTPWVGTGRFLFVATTGDGDVARVFDTDFRVQARLEDFDGRSVAVTRGVAVALGWGGLVRAPLTGGRGRVFRTFLSPETFALAVVPPSRA